MLNRSEKDGMSPLYIEARVVTLQKEFQLPSRQARQRYKCSPLRVLVTRVGFHLVYQPTYPYPCPCLSIYLSIYLSVCLSVCLSGY